MPTSANTVRLDRAVRVGDPVRCRVVHRDVVAPHAVVRPLPDCSTKRRKARSYWWVPAAGTNRLLDTLAANIVAAAVADPGYPWGDHLDGAKTTARRAGRIPERADARHPDVGAPGPAGAAEPAEPIAPHARESRPGLTVAVERRRPAGRPHLPPARRAIELARPRRCRRARPSAALGDRVPPGPPIRSAEDAEIVVAVAPALTPNRRAAGSLTALVGGGRAGLRRRGRVRGATRCGWSPWAPSAHDPTTRHPSPAHAALAAMHRSLGFEHPEQTFAHLDLPRGS